MHRIIQRSGAERVRRKDQQQRKTAKTERLVTGDSDAVPDDCAVRLSNPFNPAKVILLLVL